MFVFMDRNNSVKFHPFRVFGQHVSVIGQKLYDVYVARCRSQSMPNSSIHNISIRFAVHPICEIWSPLPQTARWMYAVPYGSDPGLTLVAQIAVAHMGVL